MTQLHVKGYDKELIKRLHASVVARIGVDKFDCGRCRHLAECKRIEPTGDLLLCELSDASVKVEMAEARWSKFSDRETDESAEWVTRGHLSLE